MIDSKAMGKGKIAVRRWNKEENVEGMKACSSDLHLALFG